MKTKTLSKKLKLLIYVLSLLGLFICSNTYGQNVPLDKFEILNPNPNAIGSRLRVLVAENNGPDYWESDAPGHIKIEGVKNTPPFDKVIRLDKEIKHTTDYTMNIRTPHILKDDGYSYKAIVTYRGKTEIFSVGFTNLDFSKSPPLILKLKSNKDRIDHGKVFTVYTEADAQKYEWSIETTDNNLTNLAYELVESRGKEADFLVTDFHKSIKIKVEIIRNGSKIKSDYLEVELNFVDETFINGNAPLEKFEITNKNPFAIGRDFYVRVSHGPFYWETDVDAHLKIEGTKSTPPYNKVIRYDKDVGVSAYSIHAFTDHIYKDDGYSYKAIVTYKGKTEIFPIGFKNIDYTNSPLKLRLKSNKSTVEFNQVFTVVAEGGADDYRWSILPREGFLGTKLVSSRGKEADFIVTDYINEARVYLSALRNGDWRNSTELDIKVNHIKESRGEERFCGRETHVITASNVNSDDVYTWSVEGASIVGNSTSNRITISTPDNFSRAKVNFSVKTKFYSYEEKTKTFSKASGCPDLSIPSISVRESGNRDDLCPNTTYTIRASSGAKFYDWDVSGASITRNNGSSINIRTNSSFSKVNISVRAKNDGDYSRYARVTFDRCCPRPSSFIIRHGDNTKSGQMCRFSTHELYLDGADADEYEWTVSGARFFINAPNGQRAYATKSTTTQKFLNLETNNGNQVTVTVRAKNNCSFLGRTRTVIQGFTLVRNCTTNIRKASKQITNIETKVSTLFPTHVHAGESVNIELAGDTFIKDLIVYDLNGKSVYQKSDFAKKNLVKIETDRFNTGIYIVKVITNKGAKNHKIVVD